MNSDILDRILVLEKEARKNFKKLIKEFMKTQGFTSRGNNFYKRHPEGNIGIITFQNHHNLPGRFYIDIGVYSIALAEFFLYAYTWQKKEIKTYPNAFNDGHWCMDSFVPYNSPDYQRVSRRYWDCDYDTDIEALAAEIIYLIKTYAIPKIDNNITDRQILNWSFAPGWERFSTRSLREQAALALILGEHEKLKAVLIEFKTRLPECAKDYVRIAKAVGFDTERQIFDRCFAMDWKKSSEKELIYIAELALTLGEHAKVKEVLTEVKKRLPKPSSSLAKNIYYKEAREDYQRVIKEAGLESEGF